MHKWITFPHREGVCSKQAHADFPEEAIYEREAGRSGFFGPAAHFHHQHAPTGWSEWEGELRPRAFDFNLVEKASHITPWAVPHLLQNANCKIRVWRMDEKMDFLVRNADGDELLFIHQGTADLYCDYGHLKVSEGDYVMIPRSTSWRLEPSEPMFILMIENTDAAYIPNQLEDAGLRT